VHKIISFSILSSLLFSCNKNDKYTSISHNIRLQNKSSCTVLFKQNTSIKVFTPNGYINSTELYLSTNQIINAADNGPLADTDLNTMLSDGSFSYINGSDTFSIPKKIISLKHQRVKDNLAFESSLSYYYDFELTNADIR
jgi:hypothetical protein